MTHEIREAGGPEEEKWEKYYNDVGKKRYGAEVENDCDCDKDENRGENEVDGGDKVRVSNGDV